MNLRSLARRIVLAALVTGCAAPRWQYLERSASVTIEGEATLETPAGWVRDLEHPAAVTLTRDGLRLQRISVDCVRRPEPPFTSRSASTLGRADVAEWIEARIRSANPGRVELLATEPAQLDGRAAVRMRLSSLSERRSPHLHLVYGCVHGDALFVLEYEAPELQFFERDRETFEAVVASFRVASSPP